MRGCHILGVVYVIGSNQGIPEIPGVLGKCLIIYIKTEIPEVLDCEYGSASCITFTEWMYLPNRKYRKRAFCEFE